MPSVSRSQEAFAPQGLKRLLHLSAACALNNFEFMVHQVLIYKKNIQIKDFDKEKNPYNILVFIIFLMHMKQK